MFNTQKATANIQKKDVSFLQAGIHTDVQLVKAKMDKTERITNPASHYPMRSDLSTSDFIYQSSDYIIILHRPELLGITEYGPFRQPVKDVVYLHLIKNREGELKILKFINELKYNNLIEPEE